MKRHKFNLLAIVLIATLFSIGWYVPFKYNNIGYCGESLVYRYKLGVYSCEWNSEAHPDFQCWRKMGGFINYIGLRKLKCDFNEINMSANETSNQDTLRIIRFTIQKQINDFEIIDWYVGDINMDGIEDFVAIIDSNKLGSGYRTICLLETLESSPLNLNFIKSNSSIIECSNCGGAGIGDPYRETIINNGTISFIQLFGACSKDEETITFNYSKNEEDWFLLKKETLSYSCPQENNENEIKVKTKTEKDLGVVSFSEFK